MPLNLYTYYIKNNMPYIYKHTIKHLKTYIYKFKWVIRKSRKYSSLSSLQLKILTSTSRTHRIISIIHMSLLLHNHPKRSCYEGRGLRVLDGHTYISHLSTYFYNIWYFVWLYDQLSCLILWRPWWRTCCSFNISTYILVIKEYLQPCVYFGCL